MKGMCVILVFYFFKYIAIAWMTSKQWKDLMFGKNSSWKLLQTEKDCSHLRGGSFWEKPPIILANFYDKISETTECSAKKMKLTLG